MRETIWIVFAQVVVGLFVFCSLPGCGEVSTPNC